MLVLWKRTRWYALSFGYVLHVGIFATMEVTHFSWTILSFYWLMIPGAVLIDMAGKATGSVEKRIYTVFYDGMCPICKKSKRTLERLESGESATQLSGFIRVCRALGLLERLDALLPESAASPIAQLQLHGRKRQRASGRRPVAAKAQPWTWGEQP